MFKIYTEFVIRLGAFSAKCNWLEERVMFSEQK